MYVSRLFTKTSDALQHNPHLKKISACLARQTKNEEKDSNSSAASLFNYACLGFSSPDHTSITPIKLGVQLVTKFGRALGATVVVLCRLYTTPSGYKIGHSKRRSTLH